MTSLDLTGKTIGDFELLELYGRGGMGSVYRAYQSKLDREVAFKVLAMSLTSDDVNVQRFYREARTAASLEHPNIVPVYEFGTFEDINYVVMRLLTGGSLAERLKHRENMHPSLGEVSNLMRQLAGALDYAHSRNIIHRDIKSNNIMFDNHGNPYLVDFGLAKALESSSSAITASGAIMGTPTHMPPEQWLGEELSSAADQYALSVVVYRMVTGSLPFEAASPLTLATKHMHELPRPLRAFRTDIPHEITDVVYQAMAKKPEDRYPSVGEFASEFEEAIAGNLGMGTRLFTYELKREIKQPRTVSFQTNVGVTPAEAISAMDVWENPYKRDKKSTRPKKNPAIGKKRPVAAAPKIENPAATRVVLPVKKQAPPEPDSVLGQLVGYLVKTGLRFVITLILSIIILIVAYLFFVELIAHDFDFGATVNAIVENIQTALGR